jgi:hypothetical protein
MVQQQHPKCSLQSETVWYSLDPSSGAQLPARNVAVGVQVRAGV